MQLDTSAILWSAPERERAGRPLLVLLHGYGSHEGDLFGMSPGLPLGPVVASLRAPIAENGGWAWWSRADSPSGDPQADRVDAAADAVIEWLDSLEFTSVSLVGFSQGAALALQLLRHAPGRFTATVAIAGFVASGPHPGDAELAVTKPPVFWGRGTEDRMIPAEAVARTAVWLPEHADATIRIYEDLGHAISAPMLIDFVTFLRERV
ncbi:MAG: Phospholipase [Rhodoglobus sp.]|nr:Phospholipase [Rhodoglobus sp.]